jgi:hypothetical protein
MQIHLRFFSLELAGGVIWIKAGGGGGKGWGWGVVRLERVVEGLESGDWASFH